MTTTYMETKNNPIIADTSALVSLIIPSDVNHAEAVKEATRLLSTDRLIILPSEVLLRLRLGPPRLVAGRGGDAAAGWGQAGGDELMSLPEVHHGDPSRDR